MLPGVVGVRGSPLLNNSNMSGDEAEIDLELLSLEEVGVSDCVGVALARPWGVLGRSLGDDVGVWEGEGAGI